MWDFKKLTSENMQPERYEFFKEVYKTTIFFLKTFWDTYSFHTHHQAFLSYVSFCIYLKSMKRHVELIFRQFMETFFFSIVKNDREVGEENFCRNYWRSGVDDKPGKLLVNILRHVGFYPLLAWLSHIATSFFWKPYINHQ